MDCFAALAMTGRERLFFLLVLFLRRPLIRNAPDHGGIAELLPQVIHRALGVRRAAVEHVGVVGQRSLAQRADAGADQAEGGAVDLPCQHFARHRKNLGGELRRRVTDQDPLAAAMFEAGRWDVIPGAEPDDDFRGRVQRAIERIAAAHPDEVVVAVVHGGVIGQAMNIASGARGFAFTGSDNASVSHLVITPHRWIIRCFNDTAHLSDRFSTADDPPPVSGIRPAGVTF